MQLELRASFVLAMMLAVAHGGALAVVFTVPLTIGWRLALASAIAVSLVHALACHALRRTPNAIVAFELNEEDDGCAVRLRGTSAWQDGKLIDRWIHPWLTLLVVRRRGRRWATSVVVPADAVEPDSFRRLRIRLRMQSASG